MGFLGNANGTGVIIGVIDTGVDLNHPEYLNASGHSRVLPGACFAGFSTTLCSTADNKLGGDDSIWPTVTHGTHVAGIALTRASFGLRSTEPMLSISAWADRL
jgi:subtilisin family serine protease